ncbi:uncharacterized protein LOC106672406 [Cimex lectularius]|uniref:Uncharacterized protein n=1 Tax=Cimex lectularius TaxID=79782 RepID=A0A8I6S7K3_CIMLE|nr:uncharacterized protein LOC106672406 [Cimex lectularius]
MPGIGNEQATTTTRILTKKPKRGKRQKKSHKKGTTFKKIDDNKWIESNRINVEKADIEDMRLLVHCNKMLNAHERRISDGLLVQQCFRAHRQDEQRKRRRRHKKANKSDDEHKEIDDDDPHPSLHLTVKI